MYNCMIKDFLEVNFKTLTGSIKSFKDDKSDFFHYLLLQIKAEWVLVIVEINSFNATVLFLYPLKTETLWFSDTSEREQWPDMGYPISC